MHSKMNYKINQVTDNTLVVGIDIAKRVHYACFVDERGRVMEKAFAGGTFYFSSSGGAMSRLFASQANANRHNSEKRTVYLSNWSDIYYFSYILFNWISILSPTYLGNNSTRTSLNNGGSTNTVYSKYLYKIAVDKVTHNFVYRHYHKINR